ncbi:hypothetical protein KR018_011115 [Drosophila ironensis]|nr:hypothetical protein KR018_011115 [Drosophila ironensis]
MNSILKIIYLLCLVFGGHGKIPNEVGLYNESEDNVIMLDSQTLGPTLTQRHENKLVQFLNSFCGDCQRFAPVFKTISRDLYQWRSILRIYAVDCAQERNVEICREFNIRQTPTLRYFSSDLMGKPHGLGIDIPSQDPKTIISALSDFVAENKYDLPGQPNFEPLNSNETAMSVFENRDQAFLALVFQPKDSQIGRETLLGLLRFKELAVRIVDNLQLFSNFGVEPSSGNQTVVIIDQKGHSQYLPTREKTSEAYIEALEIFLKQFNYKPLEPLPAPSISNYSEFLDQQKLAIIGQVLMQPQKIYRADLEQAIDKLLHIELPKTLIFEGEKLTALQNFIRALSHLNPLNKNGKLLFINLDKALGIMEKISGAQFVELVDSLEKPLQKIFKGKRYVGCVSSRPLLRGFTCSLWSLFHFLTVEAAKSPEQFPPGTVLVAIHGFVKNFFGCSDCSNHFQEMAKRRRMDLVKTHEEEILWLWGAHNEVNERLAGDTTEDPQFPKIQFPRPESCPSCGKNNNEWNSEELVKYLRHLYDRENLSFYGLPTSQGYD